MQNKMLKGALISTMVFSVLFELTGYFSPIMIRLLNRWFGFEFHSLYPILFGTQDGLFVCTQLSFMVAGLALLLGNRKSWVAVTGGGLMCLRSLMLLTQTTLWHVFDHMGNTIARDMVYSGWPAWTQIILFIVVYCLIAWHYDSKIMLALGICVAVLKVVIQVLFVCTKSGDLGRTTYTIISGLLGILVFVAGLVYLILWFRETKKQKLTN